MHPREWTLFLISQETGKEMPHWRAYTRKRCREELRSLKNQCGGKLPKSLKAVIKMTRDYTPKQQPIPFAPSAGRVGGFGGYAYGGPVI